jgi:HD-GYP domain-containing protein (c-di-GMP phosphodiesterase class II)
MAPKTPLKQISIDQLTPGMFIVEVDVPWYRTPFFSHKRLVEDVASIRAMKECGIRTVTIDISKGTDLRADAHSKGPVKAGTDTRGAMVTGTPTSPTHLKAQTVQTLYAEAHEAVERIFTDLEQGAPPSPAATKAVVSGVLTLINDDRASVLTHFALTKLKQFDVSLAAHALDTCILSLIIGMESELDEAMQAHLGMGALLHDAGYTQLPRNLVRKRAACSEQERLVLQQHPALGTALLTKTGGLDEAVIRIVAEHHERGDGSGFPTGQKCAGISKLAAIVGIVDCYDGMVSRRGGRAAMMPYDAVRRLFLAGNDGRFEISLVENVIRSIGVYPIGSLVLLNTGEHAVVTGINLGHRLKPLIKIIGGSKGESYPTPLLIDLAAQTTDREARSVLRGLDPIQERVNIAMYLDETQPEAA